MRSLVYVFNFIMQLSSFPGGKHFVEKQMKVLQQKKIQTGFEMLRFYQTKRP